MKYRGLNAGFFSDTGQAAVQFPHCQQLLMWPPFGWSFTIYSREWLKSPMVSGRTRSPQRPDMSTPPDSSFSGSIMRSSSMYRLSTMYFPFSSFFLGFSSGAGYTSTFGARFFANFTAAMAAAEPSARDSSMDIGVTQHPARKIPSLVDSVWMLGCLGERKPFSLS